MEPPIFVAIGYRSHVSHIYPEVRLYGCYASLDEAQARCVALCGEAPVSTSIARGRGYVLWVRELPRGDAQERW